MTNTKVLTNEELTLQTEALKEMQERMIVSQGDLLIQINKTNETLSTFDDRLKHQEDMTNTLGFGYHSKEFNRLKAAYLNRIRNDIFNPDVCGDDFKAGNYSLAWKPFFMSWITHDIAHHFEVSKIGNIKAENYAEAMEIASTWKPSTHRIKEALERVKEIHFEKPYKADRWSAFRHYMADTNDGELNPWA